MNFGLEIAAAIDDMLFDNVRRYNKRLLDMSMGHFDKVHYRKGESQIALFEGDCFALSPLPGSRF